MADKNFSGGTMRAIGIIAAVFFIACGAAQAQTRGSGSGSDASASGAPLTLGPAPTAEARALRMALRMVPHIRAAEDMAPELADFAERWKPNLVISDPLVYAAPIAAAAAGAPLVRHLWGPDMSRHIALPGTGVGEDQDPRAAWPEDLVRLYKEYGAEPLADLAAATLDTCPTVLQVPGVPNRIPVRYTPVNGAAVVPPWTLEEPVRPRICVTWGSTSTALAGPDAFLVPRILEAVDGLDVEVIVAIRSADRSRVPQPTDGVRVVENLPLDVVLPTCSAVIYQSGAGTALTAAYYGVPQVLLPQVADQGLVSERVAASGAGIALGHDDSGTEAIRTAAREVLTAPYRKAADRLRHQMLAVPSAGEAVATIEDLVWRFEGSRQARGQAG